MYFRYAFGVAGDRTSVPYTAGDGSVNYQDGYGPDYSLPRDTDPDARNIERTKYNQVLYDITSTLQQYQQNGTPVFITTSDNGGTPYNYTKDAIVLYDNGTSIDRYVSLTNGNNTLPTNTSNWAKINTNPNQFYDGSFALLNTASPTKIAQFSAASITAGQTRTYTLPDLSATLAHIGAAAQTFAGDITVPTVGVSSNTIPASANCIYLPATNTLGFAINGTGEVQLTSAALSPVTNDGNALGTTTLMWADLFLAPGGVINWNNGDVTIAHSTNTLAFAGASSGYTFDAVTLPDSNDGAALGSTAVGWSDLHLATGGVINWSNGNASITHSNALLTANVSFVANSFVPSSNTAPTNGIYLPAANTLGFSVNSIGEVQLTSAALSPITNDGNALGTSTLMWSDLYLADGSVINWNNGDLTATHSLNTLTFAGGNVVGLGATTATSINFGQANSLDYFNWTDFTPTVAGDGTAGTASYSRQIGKYIRIGNFVYFTISIVWSSLTGTGNLIINGLPFTCINTAGLYWSCTVGNIANLTTPANTYVQALVDPNTTRVSLWTISTSGGTSTGLAVDNAASLWISGFYQVAP